jgi:hypothetical protein
MVTKEDIEGFLERLSAEGASSREVEPGLWVVKPGGALDFEVVVHFSPPVVVLRVNVMAFPKDPKAASELSRRLLEMNASDMVHGSYGIEQNSVVITEALELSHLDFEEFLAAYESIAIALASHLREIGSFSPRRAATPARVGTGRTAPSKGDSGSAGSAGRGGNSKKTVASGRGARGKKGGRGR